MLIDYVRQYAARGWCCFPLKPRSKIPLIATKARGRGFHDATTDAKQLETWWAANPQANIGLATGASGLVVIDVDGPEGRKQLEAVAKQYGAWPLPRTLAQRTGRDGGLHLIYRGTGVPSYQDNRKGEKKVWFIDVRGSTGYIVAPPSIHPSGAVYQWVDASVPIADVPLWLVQWIASVKGSPAPQVASVLPAAGVPQGTGRGLAARSVANLTQNTTPFSEAEADRLFSALSMLDAATDGATWFAYGAALHDLKWIVNGVDEAFEIWDEWSSTSKGDPLVPGEGGYKGRPDLEKRWASFGREYQGVRAGVGSIYKAAFERGWKYEPVVENINGHEALHTLPKAFTDAAARAAIMWPDRDKAGNPKQTCANACHALNYLGITAEYDRFHNKMKIAGQPMGSWVGDLTDNIVHMLRVILRQTLNFDPGNLAMRDAAAQECLQRAHDPVLDYLHGLQWDGTPRLRHWLAAYMGAPDSELNQAIGGLALIAAVRRARQPGCKFDQIIVMIGAEGRGKSQAIEILAGRDNFSDQTILTLSDVRQQEMIQGVWLYEIADLAGLSKADVEKVKAFASRHSDRARPAYGHFLQIMARRCVFFATTNHTTFLKSQTGNRRFWPVEVGIVDLAALARDRDQLWAEAAMLEARGVPLFLPEKLWGEAAAAQNARLDTDPWEDVLAGLENDKHVARKMSPDGRGFEFRVTTRDLLELVLRVPIEKQIEVTAKRVTFIMRRLGWEGPTTLRVGDKAYKGWTKPDVTVTGGGAVTQ
jgi:Virulence-associated protein E/Bifunctional DNA primase/polymerase, N-terminal/Primase C terminal 2 (PriCT-2)